MNQNERRQLQDIADRMSELERIAPARAAYRNGRTMPSLAHTLRHLREQLEALIATPAKTAAGSNTDE